MNYSQAVARAEHYAKLKRECRHVVYEDGEYHVATDFDMDTFFLGAEPVVSVSPEGEVCLSGD